MNLLRIIMQRGRDTAFRIVKEGGILEAGLSPALTG